ncbi:hypothetical protein C8R46DRAFT_1351072 [Mycena filopes]|nr:hypothetical protein C8R46DRAFT_1351072 [Mycena filopes]
MKPKNLILRRRLTYVESQLETESTSSRHSPRLKEERQRRLTEEKIAIQKSLDSIVYPILTLPVELTGEIFLHCLPDTPTPPSSTMAPMLLARICQYWRDIACSTPRLWAALRVVSHQILRPKFHLLLSEWLRRSRAAPAYLSLTLPYSYNTFDPFLAPSPFTAHWAHLTSFHGINFNLVQCLHLLSRAPRLAHCEFTLIISSPIPFPLVSNLLLAGLEHLRLGAHHGPNHLLDSLTAPALQSLKFSVNGNFAATSLHSFLARARNIQTLDVTCYGCPQSTGISTALAAMPNLTALRLNADPTFIFDILHLVAESPTFLPNVQQIAMSAPYYHTIRWTDTHIRVLIDAVTSRSEPGPGVAQLMDFELSCTYMDPTVLNDRISACISELKGNGMRIHVGRRQTAF